MIVQQAGAGTDQVMKVGVRLFTELAGRARKYENAAINLGIKLATVKGMEVPDFVKEAGEGPQEGQDERLLEWLGQVATAEETTTAGRASSRKRGRVTNVRGTSRGKRGGGGDEGAMVS